MSGKAFPGYSTPPGGEQLTVVIPAFNEEKGLATTLRGLQSEPALEGATIIVIDDGSRDNTAAIALSHGVKVIRNATNLGYGASIKRGVRSATTPLVAWFDADDQHRPADLAAMLAHFEGRQTEAVLGARTRCSHAVKSRALGKAIVKSAAELAVGGTIPDVNCGLRVFRREVLLQLLHLLPDGFSASTTSTLLLLKRNYQVVFHPVAVRVRKGSSSVRQIRDGLRALHTIMRVMVLFNAMRLFGVTAFLAVGLGLAYGIPVAIVQRLGFPVLAELLIVLGVQIFCLGMICDQISAFRMERLERARLGAGEGYGPTDPAAATESACLPAEQPTAPSPERRAA